MGSYLYLLACVEHADDDLGWCLVSGYPLMLVVSDDGVLVHWSNEVVACSLKPAGSGYGMKGVNMQVNYVTSYNMNPNMAAGMKVHESQYYTRVRTRFDVSSHVLLSGYRHLRS